MKANTWIFVILLFVLTSCAIPTEVTFKGMKPIYPEVGSPYHPKLVDSLQPNFQWQAYGEPNAVYDFIIYEVIKESDFWRGTQRSVGREVYYREELRENEHKIEEDLQPETEYYWSVRVRLVKPITDWSCYDYHGFVVFRGVVQARNYLFMFKTPKK